MTFLPWPSAPGGRTTAVALVEATLDAYLGLARKVISPSRASSRLAMPRTRAVPSPITLPPRYSASSFRVFSTSFLPGSRRDVACNVSTETSLLLLPASIEGLQDLVGHVGLLIGVDHAVVLDKNKRIDVLLAVILDNLDDLFDDFVGQLIVLRLEVVLGILEKALVLLELLLVILLLGAPRGFGKEDALLFQFSLQLLQLLFPAVLLGFVLVSPGGELFLGLLAGIGLDQDLLDVHVTEFHPVGAESGRGEGEGKGEGNCGDDPFHLVSPLNKDRLEKTTDREFEFAAGIVYAGARIDGNAVLEPQRTHGRKPAEAEAVARLHARESRADPVVGVADIEEQDPLEPSLLEEREGA